MGKRRERVAAKQRVENEFKESPFLVTLPYDPDPYQKKYMKSIQRHKFTAVDAKSGTGKTTLAVKEGFESLRRGESKKLMYLRYVDDRYLSEGFLPGDSEEKERELFFPFFDALEELGVSPQRFRSLKAQGIIELRTDRTERGRNRKGTFLIVDEAQNARKYGDLKLVFTRLHDENGRSVFIGHSGQLDNRSYERTPRLKLTPFQAFIIHMIKQPWANQAILINNYRGLISQWADEFDQTIAEL